MAPKDDKQDAPERAGLSRRAFLKSTGVGSLAVGVVSVGEADAQTPVRTVGPGEVPVTLTVNGKRIELKIEPRVTLLDAMRQRADLTGNKRGCDRGACGACTMIVDGRTVYSCSTLAIEVQGKQIRTVDGLSAGNTLHPVQQAFCDARRADVRLLHARLHHGDRRPSRKKSAADPKNSPRRDSTATSAAAGRSFASWKRR